MRAALIALVVFPLPVATGCESTTATPNPWCKEVKKGRVAFDTTKVLDRRALDEYERIERKAPSELADDLRTIRISAVAFAKGDTRFYQDEKRFVALGDAIHRVNDYLEN